MGTEFYCGLCRSLISLEEGGHPRVTAQNITLDLEVSKILRNKRRHVGLFYSRPETYLLRPHQVEQMYKSRKAKFE
jgi:hypothetical protein